MTLNVSLISSTQLSDWTSCRSICSNLIKCYQNLEEMGYIKLHYFSVSRNGNHSPSRVAPKILAASSDVISFVDHDPDLIQLINELTTMKNSTNSLPRVIFHIYGDFVEFCNKWENIGESLKLFHVDFICASSSQKSVIKKCVTPPESVNVIPFPVNNLFSYDENIRSSKRESLGFSQKDFLFIYTGRLSLQKNDLALVNHFLFLKQNFNIKGYLLLAGEFDDFGVPYFGIHHPKGTHRKRHRSLLQKYPSTLTKESVIYLGKQPPRVICQLLNASDCFISLSAHNDEDFGMSVAESGCCGLKTILTKWGGYIDLGRILAENNSFVPLRYNTRLTPSSSHLIKTFLNNWGKQNPPPERHRVSQKLKHYCSIDSTTIKLIERLKAPSSQFQGFTDLFFQVTHLVNSRPASPFWQKELEDPLSIYKKIYGDYGDVTFSNTY